MSEPTRCPCGEVADGWPGDDGAVLCQDCWEKACDEAWWRATLPETARRKPLADLFGSDPDFTSGQDSVAFVREGRGGR